MRTTFHTNQSGFTLLETLVSFLILSAFLGVLSQTIFVATKQIKSGKENKELWTALMSAINEIDEFSDGAISLTETQSDRTLSLGLNADFSRTIILKKSKASYGDKERTRMEIVEIVGFK